MKKIKGLVLALGLSLLLVPSVARAEEIDPLVKEYIPKIESGDILPPQYIGTDNKLIKDKIPSVDYWIKSVEAQKNGVENKVIKIDSKKKNFKIKKVNKKGEPIQGAVFEVFNTKADADKGQNALKTITSDKEGIVNLDTVAYYGFYVKEKSVPSPYVVKEDVVSFYKDNGVRFLGEMPPEKMSFVKKDKEGKVIETVDKPGKENNNINTYLQSLTSYGSSFNKGTNWLVFNDNGTEKLVSKKPLKHSIPWNYLYKAGVVFGQEGIDDLINADFSNTDYYSSQMGKDAGKGKGTPKTYKPTYITINDKKYIVRLMRAYNDNVEINNHSTWSWDNINHKEATKGSEWNRLLLPLIDLTGDDRDKDYVNGINGRYGSDSKGFVESNMPTLANYSWWTDFGGNNNSSGSYSQGSYYGSYRWTQETGYDGSKWRATRGYYSFSDGAANAGSGGPNSDSYARGWLAVLERVDK